MRILKDLQKRFLDVNRCSGENPGVFEAQTKRVARVRTRKTWRSINAVSPTGGLRSSDKEEAPGGIYKLMIANENGLSQEEITIPVNRGLGVT